MLESCDIPEIDHVRKVESGIQLERISTLKIGQTMKDLPDICSMIHSSVEHREECVMEHLPKKEVVRLLV